MPPMATKNDETKITLAVAVAVEGATIGAINPIHLYSLFISFFHLYFYTLRFFMYVSYKKLGLWLHNFQLPSEL